MFPAWPGAAWQKHDPFITTRQFQTGREGHIPDPAQDQHPAVLTAGYQHPAQYGEEAGTHTGGLTTHFIRQPTTEYRAQDLTQHQAAREPGGHGLVQQLLLVQLGDHRGGHPDTVARVAKQHVGPRDKEGLVITMRYFLLYPHLLTCRFSLGWTGTFVMLGICLFMLWLF